MQCPLRPFVADPMFVQCGPVMHCSSSPFLAAFFVNLTMHYWFHSSVSTFVFVCLRVKSLMVTRNHPVVYLFQFISSTEMHPPPRSFPSPWNTVPHHPLGDGHQVTVPRPPPPLGNRTTTVHTHFPAQNVQHKTKEFSIRSVQRAANVRRPTP